MHRLLIVLSFISEFTFTWRRTPLFCYFFSVLAAVSVRSKPFRPVSRLTRKQPDTACVSRANGILLFCDPKIDKKRNVVIVLRPPFLVQEGDHRSHPFPHVFSSCKSSRARAACLPALSPNSCSRRSLYPSASRDEAFTPPSPPPTLPSRPIPPDPPHPPVPYIPFAAPRRYDTRMHSLILNNMTLVRQSPVLPG